MAPVMSRSVGFRVSSFFWSGVMRSFIHNWPGFAQREKEMIC